VQLAEALAQLADPGRRMTDADRLLDQIQLRGVVDRDGDGGEALVLGKLPQGDAVGRRVCDDGVAETLGGEPQRLPKAVGQNAGEAGPGQGVLKERPAPDRLADHPQRHAAGPADEVRGVRVEPARSTTAKGGSRSAVAASNRARWSLTRRFPQRI
jgi:hypothetical protein